MKFRDLIASDDCSFCGNGCGHSFEAIRGIACNNVRIGFLTVDGDIVLENTVGDYSWICRECFGKIKNILNFEMGKLTPENCGLCDIRFCERKRSSGASYAVEGTKLYLMLCHKHSDKAERGKIKRSQVRRYVLDREAKRDPVKGNSAITYT